MGLFDLLKLNRHSTEVINSEPSVNSAVHENTEANTVQNNIEPDIPERVFIEYAQLKPKEIMDQKELPPEINNLQTLYHFLSQNLEKKGYDDALVNPDTSYMDEHVIYINNEIGLLISKISTYYNCYLRDIDFHIETRKRSGMVETVDELQTKKENVLEEMRTVSAIEQDASQGKGLSQNLILSYKKGFRNGFVAITYNSIFNRK